MQTKVINLRKDKYDIYIGRPSIYGNPFEIGKDGDRDMVIKLYRFYFYNRLEHDNHFKEEVLKLKGKILGCFCKPLACHGDIIAEYLNDTENKTAQLSII
jgi:hypothetical protein